MHPVWTHQNQGPWTAEVPPLPPGYDSGAFQVIEANDTELIALGGWVGQSAGPEPHHAAAWKKDLGTGLWTVELLPDTGPGFSSEAHVILVDPGDGRRTIGGTAQNIERELVPVVWEEIDGGGFNLVELAMLPGGTYGAVKAGARRSVPNVSTVLGGASGTITGNEHGVLWRHNAGVWQAPVDLGTLPGYVQSTVTGIGFGFDPDDLCLVAMSRNGLGTERATLWEVAADNTMTVYDLNDRTVNLPAGVSLVAAVAGPQALDDDPAPLMIFAGGFRNSGSPSIPHANVLIMLSGTDCNKNGEDDAIDLYLGTSADANGNHLPDECEPIFSFEALPELPGGASKVFATVPTACDNCPKPTVASVAAGQSLDVGGAWRAVAWEKPGNGPWHLIELPTPFPSQFSSGKNCCFSVEGAVNAAGCAFDPDGSQRPMMWTRHPQTGVWVVEELPRPISFDSPDVICCSHSPNGNGTSTLSGAGISANAGGIVKATLWTRDEATQTWTVELLPDYGPGFASEATTITTELDGTNCVPYCRIIGGYVQPDSGFGRLPCVWKEIAGGGFERIELPMTPGAYLGAVVALVSSDDNATLCPARFCSFAVGYNATPGGIDFYKPVVYRRIAGVWGTPLELSPLPGFRDARPGGIAVGTSTSPDGLTVVGHSYTNPGSERATLWEVTPNDAVTMYDLNSQTVNLPPGVSLLISDHLHNSGLPGFSVAGTHTIDSPLAGPVSGPHAHVLTSFAPPLAAPAPHDRGKNRYVSFAPNSGPSSVAFQITKTTAPAGTAWVGAPDMNGISQVVVSPVTRVWTEPVVHVGDCEIVPVAGYRIRATFDGGGTFSSSLTVSTISQPVPKFWADTVGSFQVNCTAGGGPCGSPGSMCNVTGVCGFWTAPNTAVNVNDYLAALQKFQGLAQAPHVTVVDVQAVSSTDPCLNKAANIADVFLIIKAFQGNVYPFTTNPATCPPCP